MAATKVGKRTTKKSKKKVAVKRAAGKKLAKSEVSARIARIKNFLSKATVPNVSEVRVGSKENNKEWSAFKQFGNSPASWTEFANYVEWPDNEK